jgi:hypothetical protein
MWVLSVTQVSMVVLIFCSVVRMWVLSVTQVSMVILIFCSVHKIISDVKYKIEPGSTLATWYVPSYTPPPPCPHTHHRTENQDNHTYLSYRQHPHPQIGYHHIEMVMEHIRKNLLKFEPRVLLKKSI